MSYSHLSIIERSKLEILHRQGKSSSAIAKELGRHSSMICRELDRINSSHPYQAKLAQNAYEERRKAQVNGQTAWLLHWRKSWRQRGLRNRSLNASVSKD